jgi:hypothetical protein
MTSREFCYWLQGSFELRDAGSLQGDPQALNAEQVQMIKNHLNLVFKHEIDPSYGSPEKQAELQAVHDGLDALVTLEKKQPSQSFHGGPLLKC